MKSQTQIQPASIRFLLLHILLLLKGIEIVRQPQPQHPTLVPTSIVQIEHLVRRMDFILVCAQKVCYLNRCYQISMEECALGTNIHIVVERCRKLRIILRGDKEILQLYARVVVGKDIHQEIAAIGPSMIIDIDILKLSVCVHIECIGAECRIKPFDGRKLQGQIQSAFEIGSRIDIGQQQDATVEENNA